MLFCLIIEGNFEKKLRQFVNGLISTVKHDVRLTNPRTFRAAVDQALHAEKDLREIDKEKQEELRASQFRDNQRPPRKRNQTPQRPHGQHLPFSKPEDKPLFPKCIKNHND